MKKLLIFTALTFSLSASAQTSPGIIAGGTFSNMSCDLFESSVRPGYHLGISFVGYYTEKFQTISEFYFETKGAKTTGRQAAYGTDLEETYEPVNFKLGSGSWSLIGNYFFLKENLGVQFGPHVKLLNFGQQEGPVRYLGEGTSKQEMISDADVIEAQQKIDFGLSFGLSGGFSDFIVAARYNLGLRPLQIQSFDGIESTVKNNSFSVSVTYVFRQFEMVVPGM